MDAGSAEPFFLERHISDDPDAPELADLVADTTGASVEEKAARAVLREQVGAAVDALPHREKEIIALRYGLNDGRPRSRDEVGRAFGVSKTRVLQIERAAMEKLRQRAETCGWV